MTIQTTASDLTLLVGIQAVRLHQLERENADLRAEVAQKTEEVEQVKADLDLQKIAGESNEKQLKVLAQQLVKERSELPTNGEVVKAGE